jgi:glycerol-1-phosphate dehydrogenase [NAD(P)+]
VDPEYGTDLLESFECDPARTLFVTMELPWGLAVPRLGFRPEHVELVRSTERGALDAAAKAIPDVETVVGVGGGSCMDFAKYLAWRRGSGLVLIPSIVSVDACVTRSVAVREQGRVRYEGDVRADRLLVDFELVAAAPARLNRAGAGDILSIHTASFDWRLAHEKGGERYDAPTARRAARLVEELERNASEVRAVTPDGIRTLVELFRGENDLCEAFGNARPEEGSEHFFAYCAEHTTGKQFVHGEIVALGVVLMSRLQGNRPDEVREALDALGLLYGPDEIGLDRGELRTTLSTLAAYCRTEGLWPTIVDETSLSTDAIDALLSDI